MTVHVVCGNDSGHVLGRMAEALALHNGWTVGVRPNRHAINLYLPYLNWRRAGRQPDVAYFTHLETNERHKAEVWATVDRAVDGRIVTARRYLDHLRRPSWVARPPIDLAHFVPRARPMNATPRIGVAGMVYGTGRKGEGLVKRLAEHALGRMLELVGSGRGWPVPTRMYKWAEMPDFYRSLDALLVTSTVEGVPMPPLEALACGVPVVVPRDVGMLDDLPNQIGIFRYEAGDFNSMVAALRRAIAHGPERQPDELRACVEQYNAGSWARDVGAALAEMGA